MITTFARPLAAFVCSAFFAFNAEAQRIALLKDGHVYVGDTDGGNLLKIEDDPRQKSDLRWDASRKRLSYIVPSKDGEKARVVLMNLNGEKLKEVAIRPMTEPETLGLRFVEDLTWLASGNLLVSGSVNPSNCETFEFDVNTQLESRWQVGRCSTFAISPDGKHFAALGVVPQFGPEEERFDTVQIDDKERVYPELDSNILISSGPVWSSDSKNIAFIETPALKNETALVVLGLDGSSHRIVLPSGKSAGWKLSWVGSRISIGETATEFVCDPFSGYLGPPLFEVSKQVADALERERQRKLLITKVAEAVERAGGKEGVVIE